ncbi:MAG TPA: hypothetical protein VIT92_10645 [Burkholderiaceae bacterium]
MKLTPLVLLLAALPLAASADDAAAEQKAEVKSEAAAVAEARTNSPQSFTLVFKNEEPLQINELRAFGSAMLTNVKDQPYSADIVTEKMQTLQDGNQISQKSVRRTYRDSAGRTRQDMLDPQGKLRLIHIADSTDGVQYTLNPAAKTATRIKAGSLPGPSNLQEFRSFVQKKLAQVGITDAPPASAAYTVEHRTQLVGPITIVTKSGEAPPDAAKLASLTSIMGTAAADRKWMSSAVTTKLGTREIEGVKVDGSSLSYTIPAGEIGNKNPITVVTETWYAPELKMVLAMKKTDPRSGDTSYRVANLKRGEQPKMLFAVPDDYKITDPASIISKVTTEKK